MTSQHYGYRPIFKKTYFFLIFILVLFELVIVRLNWNSLQSEAMPAAVFKLLLASTFPLTIFYRLFFIIRPWLMAKYSVSEGQLIIVFGKKEKSVDLKLIARLKPSLFPPRLLGGVSIELHSGQKIKMFSVLEGHDLILKKIKELRPELFQNRYWAKYFDQISFLEESWKYMKSSYFKPADIILRWVVSPILALAIPYVFMGFRHNSFSQLFQEFFWMPILIAFFLFFLLENLEHKLLIKSFKNKENKFNQKHIHYLFLILHSFITISLSYLFFIAL